MRASRSAARGVGHSRGTAVPPQAGLEEGGDDGESVRPASPGPHTCYSGLYNRRPREGKVNRKAGRGSDCSLQLDCMKSESLVTAGQPYGGEYVPRRPSLRLTALHPRGPDRSLP